MLAHALRFVERVVFVVGAGNLRAQRALEKIGARPLRRQPRRQEDGSTVQDLVFAITR